MEWVYAQDNQTGAKRWVTTEYLDRWPDDYKRLGKPHQSEPGAAAPIDEQPGGEPVAADPTDPTTHEQQFSR